MMTETVRARRPSANIQKPSLVKGGVNAYMIATLMAVLAANVQASAERVPTAFLAAPLTAPAEVPSNRPAAADQRGTPELVFLMPAHDFGEVDTGSSSLYFHAILVNDSASATATGLQVETDPRFPLSPFSTSMYGPACDFVPELSPGAGCVVAVQFAPSMPGPANHVLSVTSNEGAAALLTLTGTGGQTRVLHGQFHDWDTMPSFFSTLNTSYTTNPGRSSELAEDFVVKGAAGWRIDKVGMELFIMGRDAPTSADVHFHLDEDGVPATAAFCSAPQSPFTLMEAPYEESRAEVTLTSPCVLPPGHYWLRITLTSDSDEELFAWGLQYVQDHGKDSTRGDYGDLPVRHHPPIWRNFGGGIGVCPEWTSLAPPACGLEDFAPFAVAYGAVFWLVGQEPGPEDRVFGDRFEAERP